MDQRKIERLRKWTLIGGGVILVLMLLILKYEILDLQIFGIVLSAFFVVEFVLIALLDRAESKIKRQVLNKLIHTASAQESQPLTSGDEILISYQNTNQGIGFAFATGIIILTIAGFVIRDIFNDDFLALTVTIPLIVIYSGCMIFYLKKLRVRRNKKTDKTVFRGTVLGKEKITDEEGDNSYKLTFDTLTLDVHEYVYEKYSAGDVAEFHIYPPLKNYVLSERKLDSPE